MKRLLTKSTMEAEDSVVAARARVVKEIRRLLKRRGIEWANRSADCRDLKKHDEARAHTIRSMECQDIWTLLATLEEPPLRTHEEALERLRLRGAIR